MITLDQIYSQMQSEQSPVAFQPPACQKLYDLLMSVPQRAKVVEIGVQFGRSSIIFGLISKDKNLDYYAYDLFQEEVSKQAFPYIRQRMQELGVNWKLKIGDSKAAAAQFRGGLDLILIDGDHTYEGVRGDIEAWCDKVVHGGYVLFHDYGHDSLEGVTRAVDELMMNSDWEYQGRFDTLAVFKKL